MKFSQQVSLALAASLAVIALVQSNAQSQSLPSPFPPPPLPLPSPTAQPDGTFVANTKPKTMPEPSTAWATAGIGVLGAYAIIRKKRHEANRTKVNNKIEP